MPGGQIETAARVPLNSDKLLALARLLGRQAARELILQQQRTDGSLNDPPVGDA